MSPRKPDGTVARSANVSLKMTPSQRRMLDEARGSLSASDYIRRLIVADVRRKKRTGD